MDWIALALSLKLSAWTAAILLPVGIWLGRHLAWRRFTGKTALEATLALPLVLPPTVLGYYLLMSMGGHSIVGQSYEALFGQTLMFSFPGFALVNARNSERLFAGTAGLTTTMNAELKTLATGVKSRMKS